MDKLSFLSILFLLFTSITSSYGQNLYSLNTIWDDDFKQWNLICDEGALEGSIEMKWRLRNDYTDWTYRIGDKSGSIKQKWENNPNLWELRSSNTIVNISTIWTNDFTSFKLSDGIHTIRIERKYAGQDPIEWEISNGRFGNFTWYNEFEYDLRDWIIIDELNEEVNFELKIASIFITILQSIRAN